MKRTIVAIGACVCLATLISLAMAQMPPPPPPPPAKEKRPSSESVVSKITGETTTTTPRIPAADRHVDELLGQWKAAKTDADRNRIENQLRAALVDAFHARCANHEREIEQLEAKVKELRGQLALRRQKENEIVDFRFQQLLREAQGLGWGTEPGTGDTEKTGGPVSSGYGIATGGGGMGAFQLQQRSMNSSATGGRGGSFSWSASQSGSRSGTTSTHDSTTASPVAPAKSAAFEGFFKRFDVNGNGMLEEDEVKDTPAKSVLEAVYKQLGKEVKYPVAISDILKAFDGFQGRIRVRQRSGGEDGSTDLDIDIEPISETDAGNHETKVFSLGNGNAYTLILSANTEGDHFAQDSRAFPVEVKNDNGKITISRFGGVSWSLASCAATTSPAP